MSDTTMIKQILLTRQSSAYSRVTFNHPPLNIFGNYSAAQRRLGNRKNPRSLDGAKPGCGGKAENVPLERGSGMSLRGFTPKSPECALAKDATAPGTSLLNMFTK